MVIARLAKRISLLFDRDRFWKDLGESSLETCIGLFVKYVHIVRCWSIKPHAFRNLKQV